MIWNDKKLQFACEMFELVTPYSPEHVNPASLDLCLSPEAIDLRTGKAWHVESLSIRPGDAWLASTVEQVRIPDFAAAAIYLKSSLARQGLDHALAGWIDPGFEGTITLELHAHRPIVLQAGQRIVQLVMMQLSAPAVQPYRGRYQGQVGPTAARGERSGDAPTL